MKVRVVVVDDTDHVRKMLVDILTLHGFEVVGEAKSATDSLDVTVETSPDVVVMDYKLRDDDGLIATRSIRKKRPEQQVILYSAYLTPELKEAAREAGVAVCISKGAGVEALATEISALVMDLGR